MDNTAKDNKNHFLFGFAGMLLAEGYFKEVEAHFLPVGHTHQEIDQSFSLVSKAVGEKGALDLDDLVDMADGAWRRLDYVGTDVKVQVKLSAVDDYRHVLRYESSTRRATGEGGDGMADPAPQDRNMHHFAGLGTERWEDKENEVSRRCVAGRQGIARGWQRQRAPNVIGGRRVSGLWRNAHRQLVGVHASPYVIVNGSALVTLPPHWCAMHLHCV